MKIYICEMLICVNKVYNCQYSNTVKSAKVPYLH